MRSPTVAAGLALALLACGTPPATETALSINPRVRGGVLDRPAPSPTSSRLAALLASYEAGDHREAARGLARLARLDRRAAPPQEAASNRWSAEGDGADADVGAEGEASVERPDPNTASAAREPGRAAPDGDADELRAPPAADPGHERELARLFLGRALVQLGLPVAAAAVLAPILESRDHPLHLEALPWLAPLALAPGSNERLAAACSAYEAADLEAEPVATQPAALRAHLRYRIGRGLYDRGENEAAARVLAGTPPGSRYHLNARYLEGVAWVRMRREAPALEAFQSVQRAAADAPNAPEPGLLRDLATLAQARLLYSRGEEDPEALLGAIRFYDQVPSGSRYAFEAAEERAWARYRLGESASAMLEAQRLAEGGGLARAPDLAVLGALAAVTACDPAVAQVHLARLEAAWPPAQVDALDLGATADAELVAFARGGAGLDQVSEAARALVVRERDSVRGLTERLAAIDAERARLAEMFGGEPLAATLGAALDAEAAEVSRAIATLLRQAADRLREKLRGLAPQLEQVRGAIADPASVGVRCP